MSGDIAKGLDPRCCRPPYQGKIPETLNATLLLKPCCYFSNTRELRILTKWAEENGCDALNDLDTKTKTRDEVKETPTWKLLQQGFITGNVPSVCYEKCSDDQEARGTKEANNWKRVKG